MVLCAMGLSAVASPLLEMLAGKWGTSAPVVAFARLRTARHAVRRERLAGRAGDLSGPGDLAGDRLAVWRTQNAWRRTGARRLWSHYPRRRDELRPTAVGNALHGVAAGIERNYGLSLPVCWGPFVECLESTARERLVASATRVSGRTQALICAAVAPLWALVLTDAVARLCWLVACALCVWGAYRALRSGVEQYCEHVRDVFAVHRVRLYHAAGFAPCGLDRGGGGVRAPVEQGAGDGADRRRRARVAGDSVGDPGQRGAAASDGSGSGPSGGPAAYRRSSGDSTSTDFVRSTYGSPAIRSSTCSK